MLKNLGHSIYTVSQSLDFANPVLIVQFSLFLCPLCFLHIGRWIQRLSQIQVQCLWQNCIYYCVLWLRGRQCLVFTLFFHVSSCCSTVPTSMNSLGVTKGSYSNSVTLFSCINWNKCIGRHFALFIVFPAGIAYAGGEDKFLGFLFFY